MMVHVIALLSGIVFGIGLVVSGMTNPEKVLGFLDVRGEWDASLAFVMGGAVGVNLLAFRWVLARKPAFAPEHFLPSKSEIDGKLVGGAALFGLGWGLLGVCPGPGLVNLVTWNEHAVYFVIAMLAGMQVFKLRS